MKLKRYTKAEHINLKSNPKKSGHPAVQMQGEAAKMLALLGTRDLVVALDERGQSCTSFDFANLLALAGMSRSPFLCKCSAILSFRWQWPHAILIRPANGKVTQSRALAGQKCASRLVYMPHARVDPILTLSD
jgi:hypothetical protein